MPGTGQTCSSGEAICGHFKRLTTPGALATMPRLGWQGPRALANLRPVRKSSKGVNAHRQSACAQGSAQAEVEDEDPCAPRRAPEARRLHARVHDHAEEAELGSPEGRARPA